MFNLQNRVSRNRRAEITTERSRPHFHKIKKGPQHQGHCCLSVSLMCLCSPYCPPPVPPEEEPSLQPAEGGHGVVHGETQRLRQRQVPGCQGSAQGLGAWSLRGEDRGVLQLSGTNYCYRNGCGWFYTSSFLSEGVILWLK